jgi:hypothetical protein
LLASQHPSTGLSPAHWRRGPLFDWYFNGDVEITPGGYPITYKMSKASAEAQHEQTLATVGQ